jgi:hypothetical protein
MKQSVFILSTVCGLLFLSTGCSAVTSHADSSQASRVSSDLLDLFEQFTEYTESGKPPEQFHPAGTGLRLDSGLVLIDAASDTSGALLMEELERLGLDDGAAVGRMVSGWLPIASIGDLGEVDHLQFVRGSGVSTGSG